MTRLLIIMVSLLLVNPALAAYLGLRVQPVPPHVRAHLPNNVSPNQGVIVDWLEDISPAADNGIKTYDVILSVNGQAITSPDDFYAKVQPIQPGKKIPVQVVRQGQVLDLDISGSEIPQNAHMTPAPKTARLYHPDPASSRPVQVARFQTLPPAARPLNILGKPAFPMRKKPEKHAWGTERHIWPDFYTDGTSELWDNMINAPFKMGRMPGGWRAPSLSTPDPVTIGDAVTNQLPPMAEEAVNMMDISD